jgi:hypothetical protein
MLEGFRMSRYKKKCVSLLRESYDWLSRIAYRDIHEIGHIVYDCKDGPNGGSKAPLLIMRDSVYIFSEKLRELGIDPREILLEECEKRIMKPIVTIEGLFEKNDLPYKPSHVVINVPREGKNFEITHRISKPELAIPD